MGDARFLAAAVDVFGVVVERGGQVGGDHDDLDASIGAVDGDLDQVDGFGRLNLAAGGNDEVNGVQVQRPGFGHEVRGRVSREGGAGEDVARELEGHATDSGLVGARTYGWRGTGLSSMSKA